MCKRLFYPTGHFRISLCFPTKPFTILELQYPVVGEFYVGSLGTLCDGFWSTQIVRGLVGQRDVSELQKFRRFTGFEVLKLWKGPSGVHSFPPVENKASRVRIPKLAASTSLGLVDMEQKTCPFSAPILEIYFIRARNWSWKRAPFKLMSTRP